MDKIENISPFYENRREYEKETTAIFVNYEDYPEWASVKNCLITGSRGTGKSSVLASFDYRMRWLKSDAIYYCKDFDYLRVNDVRDNTIIGIVFKADRLEGNQWDLFYKRNHSLAPLFFSTYLNFYFAREILKAIQKIYATFYPRSTKELIKTELIKGLFSTIDPSWRKKYFYSYDFSLNGLIMLLDDLSASIRRAMYAGGETEFLTKSELDLKSASRGFISFFCKTLCENLKVISNKQFFLMIDDVDGLRTWQIRCINSFLKVAAEPCCWKLSTTRPYQTMDTEDGAKISGTDLKVSVLNDESSSGDEQEKDRIDELFNAIFKTRLMLRGIDVHDESWNIETLLGTTIDLEETLFSAISASSNRNLKNLNQALLESTDTRFTDFWLKQNNILDEFQNRGEFDRYRTNAVFAILQQFGIFSLFKYHSYRVVRAICSGSPRHFLRICNNLWPEIYKQISSPSPQCQLIDKADQDRAIRAASDELLDAIDKDRLSDTIRTSCKYMCDRLGKLFVLLTTDEKSIALSPECLSVSFDTDEIDDLNIRNALESIIEKLVRIEVIKVRKKKDSQSRYIIGLNPMLSPCYCISYRNPFTNTLAVNPFAFYRYLTSKSKVDDLVKARIGDIGPSIFDN